MSKTERTSRSGFTLVESLVAAVVILVAILAVLPMIMLTARGNTADRNRINAANQARQKLESLRGLPYDTLGPGVSTSSPPWLGYYESDVEDPNYDPPDDFYFIDTVNLSPGVYATRVVLVEPIDDPLDGTGGADSDDLLMDYKNVTVRLDWKEGGEQRRVLQRTLFGVESFMTFCPPGIPGCDPKKKGGKAKGAGGMGKGKKAKKKAKKSTEE